MQYSRCITSTKNFFLLTLACTSCMIYSTAIAGFSKYLHSHFEDQYRQMLNTHENVVNMFIPIA